MGVRSMIGVKKGVYTLIEPIKGKPKGIFHCHICGKKHVGDLYNWYHNGRRRCGHQQVNHRLYHRYKKMIERCHNPKNQRYNYYGERGIYVCERWKDSFENFLEDMEDSFEEGLELDRTDNSKGYSPENCRWVTHSENMLNRNGFKNSTGYPGVRKYYNKYHGRFQKNKKNYRTNSFDTPQEAYRELQKLKQSL